FQPGITHYLEVLDQRVALLRLQVAADHALAAAAVTEFVAAVVVAGDAGVEQEAACEPVGDEAGALRIVLEAADPELAVALGHRRQQLEQVGHRAVVQDGRGGPDAVQRPGLVAALLLHADGQAVAVHAPALARLDAGVAVGAVFHVGGDIGQALGAGDAGEVHLVQAGAEQPDVQLGQFLLLPAQLADVEAVIGDVVRGGRVGADDAGRHDAHAPLGVAGRGQALVARHRVGSVAVGAVLGEQGAALAGQLDVDLAEDLLGPGRRLQLPERFLQGVQVAQAHAGGVALALRQLAAVLVEQVQAGADAQGLADIARHGLHGRAVPLYPVEFPDVPHLRVADRGVGHPVVALVDGVAEHAVGDAAEGVGTAEAFLGRVEAAMPVVVGGAEQAVEYCLEVLAQLLLVPF